MRVKAALHRFGLALVIVALIVAFVVTGAWRLLSFEQIQAHHAQLERFVHDRFALSLIAFFCALVAVVVACIPGPGLMCTLSGSLFGLVVGGLVNLAACATGSIVVFLACRGAFAEALARRGGPRMREIEQALRRDAFSYLLALKLMPMLPFFAPNLAAGLAGVRLSAMIWASVIGSAPVCFILAGLGAGLGRAFDQGARPELHLLTRPEVIGPLLALSLLSLAAAAWRFARRRRSLPAPSR